MTTTQRSTAHRLIAAKGQAVTLTREASGAYNPATGTATITETTQTGKGVILPLAGYRRVDGVNIVAGDETMLLSALASDGTALTAPLPGDVLTLADGTTKYTFTMVNPLRPAGLDIILDCVVRGHVGQPAAVVTPPAPFASYPALAAAFAAGRGVVGLIGDSRTCGIAAASADYTLTPAKTIITDLIAAGKNAIDGFQFGSYTNNVSNPFSYDARLTSNNNGAWSISGWRLTSDITVGRQLTFTPGVTHDRVRRGTLKYGGGSTYTITRNGTILATIDENAGSPAFTATTHNVTSGTNAVVYDYTVYGGFGSGIIPLPWVQCYPSATQHAQICQMGQAGYTVADWIVNPTTPSSVHYAAVTLAANLYLVELGANDARTGVSNATYEANLDTLVVALLATGANVRLIITPPAGGASASSNIPAGYITAMNNISTARGLLAPIDCNTPFPFDAGNYDADGLHETTAFKVTVAHVISAALA